jgi:hypothetical protein
MSLVKDPAEIITITFDFSALATAVSNPTITCTVFGSVADPSASAMLSGLPQISGTSVLQRVTGGISGATYKLRCVVDDADGERWVVADRLEVTTA